MGLIECVVLYFYGLSRLGACGFDLKDYLLSSTTRDFLLTLQTKLSLGKPILVSSCLMWLVCWSSTHTLPCPASTPGRPWEGLLDLLASVHTSICLLIESQVFACPGCFWVCSWVSVGILVREQALSRPTPVCFSQLGALGSSCHS